MLYLIAVKDGRHLLLVRVKYLSSLRHCDIAVVSVSNQLDDRFTNAAQLESVRSDVSMTSFPQDSLLLIVTVSLAVTLTTEGIMRSLL